LDIELSIVVPTYNSSKWIENTISEIYKALTDKVNFEVIVVDDCSADDTYSILCKVQKNNLKIIRNDKNIGQHLATATGIEKATGICIATFDDDLQYSPQDILVLLNIVRNLNLDLVYGQGIFSPKERSIKHLLYFLYLWYLKKTKQERKTSFRLINAKLCSRILKGKIIGIFNIDGILEQRTNNIHYIQVNSAQSSKSRYNFFSLTTPIISFLFGQILLFIKKILK
jgi:glycosyltransferase involved in cell wall biosynthesis